MLLYLSKQERDNGKEPINKETFLYHKTDEIIEEDGEIVGSITPFTISDFSEKNMIEKSYDLLKERNSFFGDALDV